MLLLVFIFLLEVFFTLLPNLTGEITSMITRFTIVISDDELNTKAEVRNLKEQQSNLSVTDNFAQYARLQRKIDKLMNSLKEKDKERKQYITYVRMGVTVANYIIHVIVILVLMFTLRNEPLILVDSSWFSPFDKIIAFPTGIPAYHKCCGIFSAALQDLLVSAAFHLISKLLFIVAGGDLGLGFWLLVSNTVIHRAKSLIETLK